MARVIKVLASLSLSAAATYSPADGLRELNTVEQALHQIESAKLTAEQKKMSLKAVSDVEATVTQLKANTNMTKAQRMQKVESAIQELQGLQSQWQLSAAVAAMEKLESLPHLSAKQRETAKKVVGDVEATVSAIESGKLTGAAQHEKVGAAIKELTDLQREWLNATTTSRVEELEQEMAAKKKMLKLSEDELKLLNLQKELAEKKMLLKKLTAQKDQSADLEKARKEDAAEQAMVAKLLLTAKALAGRKTAEKQNHIAPGKAAPLAAKVATEKSPLAGILTDLKARAKKVADGIDHMDAEQKKKPGSAPARGGSEVSGLRRQLDLPIGRASRGQHSGHGAAVHELRAQRVHRRGQKRPDTRLRPHGPGRLLYLRRLARG